MWPSEGNCLGHARMGEQNLVDFAWSDLFSTAIDELFNPPGQSQVAAFVEYALVAGAEPAIDKGRGIGFRIVFVTSDDIRSLNHHLACLALFKMVALVIHDADPNAGARPHGASTARLRRPGSRTHLAGSLRHGVGLEHRNLEQAFHLFHHLGRKGRATGAYKPQVLS